MPNKKSAKGKSWQSGIIYSRGVYPSLTTILRGRAASAIRPGLITKRVLLGELPLDTGEFISEAAIVDLFNAYKRQLREYNQVHTKDKHIKGMHYRSFYTMFRFAQLLHLVEFLREEEADWKRKAVTTRATSLMRLEKVEGKYVQRISNRRVFKLSDIGKEDVKSWLDLTRAWKEQWPAPQYAEIPVIEEKREEIKGIEEPGLPPPTEGVEEAGRVLQPTEKKRRGRPPGKPTVVKTKEEKAAAKVSIPTLKLLTEPSKEQYALLITHLQKLNETGVDNRKVQKEVDKLSEAVGEWVAEATESLIDAQELRFTGKIREFRALRDALTAVDEGLLDRDIPRAIEELEKLV
jgi:hypothetical protein